MLRRFVRTALLLAALLAALLFRVHSLGGAAPGGRVVDMLTFHGDVGRIGWNPDEQTLTPSTVHSGSFGRLWSARVEGDIYAEPLVVSSLSVNGAPRPLVFVVTEGNFVYAFDGVSGARAWGPVSLGAPVPLASLSCGNIDPVGITSTPVIDRASSVIYVVALTTPDGGRTKVYQLAGLDLATGVLRPGWPVEIAPPAVSSLRFNPAAQQQRGALTLLHGIVYVPFGGYFGDCGDYHGWVVGVPAADPSHQQAFVTPTRREGGIWATGGLAADPAGDIYAATGNSDSTRPLDFGNSVVRLATLPVLRFSGEARDFFVPSNYVNLNDTDADLGSATPVVLPAQSGSSTPDLIFAAGKQGVGYLINRANMGGLGRGTGVAGEGVYSQCIFGDCRGGGPQVFSAFAYWDGGSAGRLILVPGRGSQPAPCRATGGVAALRLGVAPGQGTSAFQVAWCSPSMRDPGAPAVSSAGSENGVVWVIDTGAGTLYALDARTGAELYRSGGADVLGSTHRFITPSVSGGRVYMGTARAVVAYGLR